MSIVITSEPDTLKEYLAKIWQNRSLIFTLAKRDLKIKYAQTSLGLAWTILQPLSAVAVFTVFFSIILDLETSYPYVLFVLSGVLLWNLFNYIFSQGSSSLTQNSDLIKKMAFPKIILPISKVLLALVEFAVTLALFLVLLILFKIPVGVEVLIFPVTLIPVIALSLGMAFILSAATIKNRDLFHVIPFLVNFGIWLTPVFYPVSLIPEQYSDYLYINPMAASIQLFRWSFFGEPLSMLVFLGISICFATFIIGFFYFKKVEDKIIDII
jgi:lipopolysaccharide transport system permease protein